MKSDLFKKNSNNNKGIAVFSFDLEMAWAGRKSSSDLNHAEGIEQVRGIVDSLLAILIRYEISATWATVGHLMLKENYNEWERLKQFEPKYNWFSGNWYEGIPDLNSPLGNRYYAPDVIEKIVQCPIYQELGCHTFSHIIVGDTATSRQLFWEELLACQKAARFYGRDLKSFVFPRNIVGHTDLLKQAGFECFRGLNSEWYWFGFPAELRSFKHTKFPNKLIPLVMTVGRFFDEKLRLCPPLPLARSIDDIWEIPHSMFFPPFAGVSRYISMEDRWRRGINGLIKVSENKRIFSIYTHPHNFLTAPSELLNAFEMICRYASDLRDKGKLNIFTMDKVAEQLNENKLSDCIQ